MSELDVRALEANFEVWRKERVPTLRTSEAFERFSVEQILKDADLSDEEIAAGLMGGGDDGGIDAMYFFINRTLILDETEIPDPALAAHLYIMQAKYEAGFSEIAVQKMESFTHDLLTYSTPVETLTYLNTNVRDAIARFRTAYAQILGSQHTLDITYGYATKSDQPPNQKVTQRVENLRKYVNNQISAAIFDFQFWGAQRLLAAARTSPKRQMTIDVSKQFTTNDGSAVCLVNLKSFAAFLTDEHGSIRRSILEPNVRDYQGKTNAVNTDIRITLNDAEIQEFWWLNNGITVLATKCSLTGDKLTVEKPEIVNGLQTTQEIFAYFKMNSEKADTRNVLVRVIVPPDDHIRSRITKATNFQTPVNQLSLHATDQIHFDIEEKLRLYDLFYDRRKGEYRELRKPIAKIISIRTLARAVIAILLQRPDDARARPQSLLNKNTQYNSIFNDNLNRDLYVVCILIDRSMDEYLDRRTDLSRDAKTDIKYYADMWLSCELARSRRPFGSDIAALLPQVVSRVSDEILAKCCERVHGIYSGLGATDTVAKGPDLRRKVLEEIATEFPAPVRRLLRPRLYRTTTEPGGA